MADNKVELVAFTRAGIGLACRIAASLAPEAQTNVSAPQRLASPDNGVKSIEDLGNWTRAAFEVASAIVFVGATGIAVRAIAPFVADKMSDPAVVCVDERGANVIPLLSGHVGGANSLSRRIAAITGGNACISTATDVNGIFAVDEWAVSQGMRICDRDAAMKVSSMLLDGDNVGFTCDTGYDGELPRGVVEDETLPVGISVGISEGSGPFETTLRLVPATVTVGVGCRRGIDVDLVKSRVEDVLSVAGISPMAVEAVATIDVKASEPALTVLAESLGVPLITYSASELSAVEGDFESSGFVEETVGVDNVCERAACAAGAFLISGKSAEDGVTVAIARRDWRPSFGGSGSSRGALHVVGLGPGAGEGMTLRAMRTLASCDAIVGYTVYVDLVAEMFPDKELVSTGMCREVDRCRMALERAMGGDDVCMVCSGDPGIYGMASLILELAHDMRADVPVDVVPGVSAANGGASVLGAPLTHDFAVISLSDLLTPWEKIEARLEAAASSDLVVCLYNPSSRKRSDYLARACEILLRAKSPETVCGFVRNIGREGEVFELTTLGELADTKVDMFTTVFVGNEQTVKLDGRMVTPRGYLQRGDQ